ncbi:MAG: glycoside hydrolase family 99-like domain-containing protein, partial [Actinomycetaceae bacterium]|nr:glycoside hydrolase family 99-like domain-containing protein [Actinomycetaceae bacterium]
MQSTRLTLELVRTVDESYPIIIGNDLAKETVELASHPDLVDRRVAIITDSNVAKLYGAQLEEAFTRVERETNTFVFPAGEAMKVMCMYLPQYHSFPENDEWWGKGYTDW